MKKLLLTLSVVIASLASLQAQSWEVGLFGGGTNYIGEFSYDDPVTLDLTRPGVGALVRYSPNRFLSLRLGLTYGQIYGDDSESPNTEHNIRNLSFRSEIIELAFIPEFNIIGFSSDDRFSPYLFAGIAGFYFNPETLYQGDWIELQPLGTEGQGTTSYPERQPYDRFQLSVPFGLGFKFGFGDGLVIGLEVGLRKTFTDYLDDVSTTYVDRTILILENSELSAALSNRTGEVLDEPINYTDNDFRGQPDNYDWYMFGGLTITYRLGEGIQRGHGCPYGFQ